MYHWSYPQVTNMSTPAPHTNNPVINLSNYTLTTDESNLLSKGLKFIPTVDLDNSISKGSIDFTRTVNCQYFFRNNSKPKPAFFTKKSTTKWEPPQHQT